MSEDSRKTAGNMISMEEYLRKRQAIRCRENTRKTDRDRAGTEALKLAELLFV